MQCEITPMIRLSKRSQLYFGSVVCFMFISLIFQIDFEVGVFDNAEA